MENNRIDGAIDAVANGTKTVINGYYNTFFSEEANERYDRIGTAIGDGVVNVLERLQGSPEEAETEIEE